MERKSNSKRLAKNTVAMYFRMALLMLISLYTSRVILQKIGVTDYGIYNLVGSIVLMFNSLKSVFAGSTQRFLNYEMGRGNHVKLKLVFNLSIVINLFISLILVIGVESVGMWFMETKINVDPSRLYAAKWVFQFSILSMVVSLLTNSFNACIIAHERMDFYAYISIVEGLLKLGICYMLSMFLWDRLIFYGFLMLLVHVVVLLACYIFCRLNFEECRFTRIWDKSYLKNMTIFAGWAFFGNTSFALTQNGLNMILNVFGGPIVNAARGIAYQVSTALHGFVSNLIIVIKPFAIKTYASGEFEKSMKVLYLSTKLFFFIQLTIVICFTYLTTQIVELWLGSIPEYSVIFINLVLIHSLVKSLHSPIDMIYSAEGKLKYYQIVEGIILALPIPLSYLALEYGAPYSSVFCIVILCEVLHIFAIACLASYIWRLPLVSYLKKSILPCALCFSIYAIMYVVNYRMAENITSSIMYAIITMLVVCAMMYLWGFSNEEKTILLNIIKIKKQKNG